MVRPTEVEPREGYRIWLRYSDGASGEIDLSYLAGRGVFKCWNHRASFEAMHIAPAGGIAWGDDAELCPDALYYATHRQVRRGTDAGGAVPGGECLNSADSTES